MNFDKNGVYSQNTFFSCYTQILVRKLSCAKADFLADEDFFIRTKFTISCLSKFFLLRKKIFFFSGEILSDKFLLHKNFFCFHICENLAREKKFVTATTRQIFILVTKIFTTRETTNVNFLLRENFSRSANGKILKKFYCCVKIIFTMSRKFFFYITKPNNSNASVSAESV